MTTGDTPGLSSCESDATGHMPTGTPSEPTGVAGWKSYFVIIDGSDKARKKCTLCGVVLDVRAGRARKHLEKDHGVEVPNEARVPGAAGQAHEPAIGKAGPASASPNPYPRGSREWGIEHLRSIIDSPTTSGDGRLKALGELREWESFEGTAAFDDETEVEKHMDQWDRVVKRAKELRELSKKILRDATTRQDLMRQMTEIGG